MLYFLTKQKNKASPSWFGSVDRVSACRLKGPRFDSCQERVPWLQAPPWPWPWLGLMQETTNVFISHQYFSLSFPLSFTLFKNQWKNSVGED
jgi:hypothetical protein